MKKKNLAQKSCFTVFLHLPLFMLYNVFSNGIKNKNKQKKKCVRMMVNNMHIGYGFNFHGWLHYLCRIEERKRNEMHQLSHGHAYLVIDKDAEQQR